jgi:hypothetical protein
MASTTSNAPQHSATDWLDVELNEVESPADPLPSVPQQLKDLPNWVLWRMEPRDGRETKVPYQAKTRNGEWLHAEADDPKTWSDYATACRAFGNQPLSPTKGLGFEHGVDGCGYLSADLDACLSPSGELAPWAAEFLKKHPTYSERTPSGCGLRCIFRYSGTLALPNGLCQQSWNMPDLPELRGRKAAKLEVFRARKYITVTGEVYGPLREIADYDGFLKELPAAKPQPIEVSGSLAPRQLSQWEETELSELLAGLWHSKHKSQSEADRRACYLLAKKLGSDASKIDSAIRASKLYRPKWNRKDYRLRTIKRAIESVMANDSARLLRPPQSGDEMNDTGNQYRVELKLKDLTDITARPIDWLYEGYLPKGMLVYFFAQKGRGKTKVCDWFTTYISSGRDWPDGTKNEAGPRVVIRFNLEDPDEQVLKPCLYIAGANLSNTKLSDATALAICGEQQSDTAVDFTDPAVLAALTRTIKETNAALVILEPITNYKGRAANNSHDDMRPIYTNLAMVAKDTGACIVAVNHMNRRKDAVDLLEKSLGAAGPGVARFNYLLEKVEGTDEVMLVDAGSNFSASASLVFKIEQQPTFTLDGAVFDETKKIGCACFVRKMSTSRDEILEQIQSNSKNESDAIAAFLTEYMTGKDFVKTDDVRRACANENRDWKWATIRQVWKRRGLGEAKKDGKDNRQTWWRLGQPLLPFPEQEAEAVF